MKRSEIQAKLKDIIKPYVQKEEFLDTMTAESDLLQDLEINSAHLVDIILDMEEVFDIEISDQDAERMLSVGAAVDITERLLQNSAEK